jgi:hypothetical protein
MAVEGVTPPGSPWPGPLIRASFPRAGPDVIRTGETAQASVGPRQARPSKEFERPEATALVKPGPKRAGMRLSVDAQINRIVAKIVDETNQVIKQIPPEELLKIIAQAREIRARMFDELV